MFLRRTALVAARTPLGVRSYYFAGHGPAAAKISPVDAAIADTFASFAKTGDFYSCYEELVLRGFSDTDAINQVIDLAAKKNDEKAVTELVKKMKEDGIAINKRTVLVLRQYASKLVANERAEIEKQEAHELADLDAQLAKN